MTRPLPRGGVFVRPEVEVDPAHRAEIMQFVQARANAAFDQNQAWRDTLEAVTLMVGLLRGTQPPTAVDLRKARAKGAVLAEKFLDWIQTQKVFIRDDLHRNMRSHNGDLYQLEKQLEALIWAQSGVDSGPKSERPWVDDFVLRLFCVWKKFTVDSNQIQVSNPPNDLAERFVGDLEADGEMAADAQLGPFGCWTLMVVHRFDQALGTGDQISQLVRPDTIKRVLRNHRFHVDAAEDKSAKTD